jgi:hypothetical protein
VIVISSAGSRAGSACIWWMGKIDAQALVRRVKKIGWIFWNLGKTGGIGLVWISKPLNLLFTVSKFQKKIKVSKKYVKKLDQILRLLVKKFLKNLVVWIGKIYLSSNLFKFIQTCSTEFTVQAEFTVHLPGLAANLAGLSAKSAGWGFHYSNFESNRFRPVFTKFYRIRPIFFENWQEPIF